MPSQQTDETLISAIQSQQATLEEVLSKLYGNEEWQRSIFKLVENTGGSRQDAEDIFQEGIRRLIVNIRNHVYEGRSSLKTYHYSICRNLWISQLRRDNRRQELLQAMETPTTGLGADGLLRQKERNEQLSKALGLLDGNCRQVLELWTQGYSMNEIAEMTGYKNGQVAKKRKHVCLKKLLKALQNRPELMKTLLEL